MVDSKQTTWRLIKPYWFSEDRWRGRLLLAVIVGLSLGQVYISVRINAWNAVFYNALQDKKLDVFIHQLGVFSILAAAFIAVAVYRQYFQQMLHIRWRTWMTHRYQNAWLSARAYYRLQVLYKRTDNPDQRIADDIDIFSQNTLSLAIGLLSSVVTLVSFVAILWGLSGSLTFHVGTTEITIPGYMVWVALLYSAVGTWLTHKIGRRLVRLNFDQQRYEADYRFSLIRVRENAEAIAFYRGEAVEAHSLRERFSAIRANWWHIMRKQKQLTWFTSAYGQIANIFPVVVAAPRYFSGAIQLGGLMQTASAFGQVQGALSWLVDVYTQFATWKSACERLKGFHEAIATSTQEAAGSQIQVQQGEALALTVDGLQLQLPTGAPLLGPVSFGLKPGERLLLTGPSGAGKTTLLRTLAGLWPYGQGAVTVPNAPILFVPQKPYLPNLPLRDILSYPLAVGTYSDSELQGVLATVGLAGLGGALDASEQWGQALSLGEQQKLAFARILLQKPALVLLDEVTASLDEAAEEALYGLLIKNLPDAMVVSVGHRSSLRQWHGKTCNVSYMDLVGGEK